MNGKLRAIPRRCEHKKLYGIRQTVVEGWCNTFNAAVAQTFYMERLARADGEVAFLPVSP